MPQAHDFTGGAELGLAGYAGGDALGHVEAGADLAARGGNEVDRDALRRVFGDGSGQAEAFVIRVGEGQRMERFTVLNIVVGAWQSYKIGGILVTKVLQF